MSLDIITNVLYTSVFSAVNMNATQTGDSIAIQGITCYTIQAGWTGFNGDTAARITVYASNNNTLWTQIDQIIPSGTTGSYIFNVEKAGYRFVKVIYTQTAATGTLNATISGKII